MSVVTSNLIQGPAEIYTAAFGTTEPSDSAINTAPSASAWTDMGGTMDGVELELTQEYKELTVDQLVDIPARRLTKRELNFKTKLAEPTLDRLNWALNSATGGVQSGAGVESLEPDDSSAATQPTYSAVILDGYAPAGLRRRIILRKVLNVEGVKTSYKKEDQTVYEVGLVTHYVSPSIKPFKVVDEVAP
ncbi:hypothetical protein [Microbispora sp. KK1-11]|uniref:hypothetical protein n=1 Tax=Microbispora sp. KK1-11 TaxID=2053005 RepID=UPI00115B99CD|nr:hypothetical protein [Microbispora sp. KK1-11]TQS30054.1 hypothetical protein FLW16_06750 [Microbispora sp. KK1-11]